MTSSLLPARLHFQWSSSCVRDNSGIFVNSYVSSNNYFFTAQKLLIGEPVGSFFQLVRLHEAAAEQDVRDSNQDCANKPSNSAGRYEMPDGGGKQVDQCHRQHEFPCKVHKLVHAKARKCTADPD